MNEKEMNREYMIREWEQEGFTLRLFDFHNMQRSRTQLSYEFLDNEVKIFSGHDYGIPPTRSIDDDAAVFGLLGFLVLKAGDVDAEYFEDYTEEMQEWSDSDRCDALTMMVWEFDEYTE